MNDGDWICSDPNCGNINFARRVSCYRCNKERPDTSKAFKKKLSTEIGKTAAEKSRGLFNADDWQCNKCANVNWARRQTCNVCNAPKYGEVEARTGYGGGYNERGVVEYRRREPSSDDEYDEFGRKKRKRKPESEERERPEKVGITEGAVFKNLPPTVLQKESYKERMPVFGPNLSMNTSNTNVKRNGSLSDSSMCEIPALTKAAVSRYQQINNSRQEYMLPTYKKNGARKRFLSTSDKDQSGSSGYEVPSKKSKQKNTDSPIPKMCNPVMENSVSSTKTEIVYKLSRPNPAEDLQVAYTLHERVKCAALAIVYNNCKITASKFEAKYEKPAPDYETIFEWRNRLLTKGCLNDSHLETEKSFQTNSATNTDNSQKPKTVFRLPNPDEIIISSESEDEESSKNLENSGRSMSIETVFIEGNTETLAAGSSASTADGRRSRARSCSQSTHQRTRSNSRDSQYSHYPDTDSEKGSKLKNTSNVLKSTNVSARHSDHGSDSQSESVSYNSGEHNFLSRVFGEGRKRRKVRKHTVPAAGPKLNEYASNDVNTFEGYSTLKKSEQSPLVTGNIYTNNLRNMNSKTRNNVDIDGCSSEYVPTKIGSTAKKNYQEFKDNVRKKGYWAKGNGSSLTINRHNMSMNVIHQTKGGIPNQVVEEPVKTVATHQNATFSTKPVQNPVNDFTTVDIKTIPSTKSYLPFDIPIPKFKNNSKQDQASENIDRIFAQVQSNNVSKNRSILDIFDISDPAQESSERNNDLDKYDNIRRMYENDWDEDDEALYKNTDCNKEQAAPCRATSPTVSNKTQSPTSDMLYTKSKDSQPKDTSGNNSLPDFIKDKHDLLLDMLKDFQNKEISQMVSPLKHGTPQLQSAEDNNVYQKSREDEPILELPENRLDPVPNLHMTRLDTIPKPPMARPDRLTNPAMNRFDHTTSPNHTVKRSDTIPNYSRDRHTRVPKTMKRSELISNQNKNRPDPIPNLLMPEVSPIPKLSMTSPIRVSNFINRSDLTPNLMTRLDPIPNLSRPNQSPNHMISQSDFTQNLCPNRYETISKSNPILSMVRADRVPINAVKKSDLNPNLTLHTPDPIPVELSKEVLSLSEENVKGEGTQNATKTVSPKKRVHILENIMIQPGSVHDNVTPLYQQNENQHSSPTASQTNNTQFISSSPKVDDKQDTLEKSPQKEQSVGQVDFTNLLAGINTNALLLALQNLQHISQATSPNRNEQTNTEQQSTEEKAQLAETTINLTNDEEWEKESNRDGSIERQLQQMDGNTGDTPFLSDAYEQAPVVVPVNVVRKLNLDIPTLQGDGADTNSNENAPVIGNFKSFALPKPILLNRLKVTVKTAEKPVKSSGKRVKRKDKSKQSATPAPAPGQPDGGGGDDDEESGDEADLAKYDLWGSDAEQGNSSKADNAEKTKDGEGSKEEPNGQDDKNEKVSPNNKSKRRSRSSSSSSSTSSSSSSSHSSSTPQNKFDDFNLNSERESPPKARKSPSRSRSPRSRAPTRRKSRDSRSAGEARSHETSRDKESGRERRDRERGNRDNRDNRDNREERKERKERRYSRDGNHYTARGRHR